MGNTLPVSVALMRFRCTNSMLGNGGGGSNCLGPPHFLFPHPSHMFLVSCCHIPTMMLV